MYIIDNNDDKELLFITCSAAEAEIAELKSAHKKALDKSKKDITKLKAKVLAASKSKENEQSADGSPVKSQTDEKVEELIVENERLREEMSEMKARKLDEIR